MNYRNHLDHTAPVHKTLAKIHHPHPSLGDALVAEAVMNDTNSKQRINNGPRQWAGINPDPSPFSTV